MSPSGGIPLTFLFLPTSNRPCSFSLLRWLNAYYGLIQTLLCIFLMHSHKLLSFSHALLKQSHKLQHCIGCQLSPYPLILPSLFLEDRPISSFQTLRNHFLRLCSSTFSSQSNRNSQRFLPMLNGCSQISH